MTKRASALLESVPTPCLQMAPGGGAVLVIRDLTALDLAGSFPLAAFQIHCPPLPCQPLGIFLPLQQSWCHGTVGSVQSLVVQLISPTKVKFDLRLWSLHWNDWSTPPHVRFCQVCCRVGNLGRMDGVDSKETVMSYAPRLDSLEYICQ